MNAFLWYNHQHKYQGTANTDASVWSNTAALAAPRRNC